MTHLNIFFVGFLLLLISSSVVGIIGMGLYFIFTCLQNTNPLFYSSVLGVAFVLFCYKLGDDFCRWVEKTMTNSGLNENSR